MKKYSFTLGIDIAKASVTCHLQNTSKRVCQTTEVSTATALFEFLHRYRAEPHQTLVILEATGHYHLNWCRSLHQAGYLVLVLNPLLAKRLYSVKNAIRDQKTDAIDAQGLCRLGQRDGPELEHFAYDLSLPRLRLQKLITTRLQLVKAMAGLKRSYRGLLDVIFPELARSKGDICGRKIFALLQHASTPGRIARLHKSTRERILGTKAEAIRQLAASSMASEELAWSLRESLLATIEAIETLQDQALNLAHKIKQATQALDDNNRSQRLRSLPGIGATIAPIFAAFLPQHLSRWGNRKQITAKLLAFIGAEPTLKESGQWTGKAKMSKKGSPILRTALFQAAFCGLKWDPELRAYYDRKRTQDKMNHKLALSHVMRKQLRRIVFVLCTETPYTPLAYEHKNAA